jgi:hypothetical protein
MNIIHTDTSGFYDECRNLYSWRYVAERTELVYDYVMEKPAPNTLARLKTSYSWGTVTFLWSAMFQVMEALVMLLASYLLPDDKVDILRNFDLEAYD